MDGSMLEYFNLHERCMYILHWEQRRLIVFVLGYIIPMRLESLIQSEMSKVLFPQRHRVYLHLRLPWSTISPSKRVGKGHHKALRDKPWLSYCARWSSERTRTAGRVLDVQSSFLRDFATNTRRFDNRQEQHYGGFAPWDDGLED